MNVKRRDPHITVLLVLMFGMLILVACTGTTLTPTTGEVMLVAIPTQQIGEPCVACAQATLSAVQTQEKSNIDVQAAATADILRANAQATLNSANATLIAVQTQQQNNENILAAQLAATAEFVRANAQATLNSAGSTQIAAMTQSQYNLLVTESARTQSAVDMLTQQNKNDLVAGTQTAIADTIATQTQVAVATSQWYIDQERQRDEQRQGPLAILWMWCLPMFALLIIGLAVWMFTRWLRVQQDNQRILENPVERLPALEATVRQHRHDDPLPYIESDVVDSGYQVTTPDDQVGQWLDEVKDELQNSDKKDKDDDAGN